MGFWRRFFMAFKALGNDGPHGDFERFRVSQLSDADPPSKKIIELNQNGEFEIIKISDDIEVRIFHRANGWYYMKVGGGVAVFATGGPFPDRDSLLKKIY